MASPAPTCPRHPATTTRLSCSSCATAICPACAEDAAVGYHCPDCAAARHGGQPARRRPVRRGGTGRDGRLPAAVAVRATAIGAAACVGAGLVLSPILAQGTLFLLSAGVLGWLVARSVFWAADERTSPYLRAIALTLAGFAVAIGMAVAGVGPAPPGILLLAYPAAMYGGWIVVRQR